MPVAAPAFATPGLAAPGAAVRAAARRRPAGVTATMHGGIELRFGTAGAARAKWAAAAAILADRRLETLAYVDVRVPQRPAVG